MYVWFKGRGRGQCSPLVRGLAPNGREIPEKPSIFKSNHPMRYLCTSKPFRLFFISFQVSGVSEKCHEFNSPFCSYMIVTEDIYDA